MVEIIEYHIEYGEQYAVAGVITDFKDLTTGSTKYAWCGSFKENQWITEINKTTPFGSYIMDLLGGNKNQFLTNYKTPKVKLTDLGWTWLMTDNVNDIDYVEIKTYDSAGALINTFTAADLSSTLTPGKVKSVATSPQSLNNINPLLTGVQPVITSAVDYYTIQIFESTPTAISEILTFTIQEDCRYETFRLHFLNELGGFDSYNFLGRNQRSASSKRKFYTRAETVINSTGITYSHENIGSLDYYVRTNEKIKLKSEYLTNTESDWLQELVNSPNVLLEVGESEDVRFYPVRVTTNGWTEKITEIDKLFKLEIDVELALQNTRQRR